MITVLLSCDGFNNLVPKHSRPANKHYAHLFNTKQTEYCKENPTISVAVSECLVVALCVGSLAALLHGSS